MAEAIKREIAEDPEVRGMTFEEILQSKVDEERRRKMAMKECEFPGCEKSFYTQGD